MAGRSPVLVASLMLSFMTGVAPLGAAQLECLSCHSAPGFRGAAVDGTIRSIHVDQATIDASAHAGKACVDCHVDFVNEKYPHKQHADPVQCAICHYRGNSKGAPDVTNIDLFSDSVHGRALNSGDKDAPSCRHCHGTHDIKKGTDLESLVHRSNVVSTCGACHFDTELAKRHDLSSVESYKDSVHAKVVAGKDGPTTAAVCTDCHGVHDIAGSSDPSSPVNRLRVPETCGKCHEEIRDQYMESIHGKAVANGVTSAPVCTDCHGEHLVVDKSKPQSSVNPSNVVATCSKCHEDQKIQSELGLATDRLASYEGSFHGVANKFGDKVVANCATCHGAHDVLPSSDPRSAIHKDNLTKTCGNCHPGASKNFAAGTVHVYPTPKNDVIVFWVRAFYTLFIVGIIGGFCGYILLDLRARWIGRLPWRQGEHRK